MAAYFLGNIIILFSGDSMLCKQKYPHFYTLPKTFKDVDIVDKLFAEERFPDFNNVAGSHSYQQVAFAARL